jgi:hypothetical protein
MYYLKEKKILLNNILLFNKYMIILKLIKINYKLIIYQRLTIQISEYSKQILIFPAVTYINF